MSIKKYAVAGLLGTALLTSAAFAQTTTTPPAARADATTSSTATLHQGLWRASKLVGVKVYNESNESLGSINDLIVDKSGNIKNVVIGVGGFLGVGERYIAVSFDKLKWVNEPMRTASTTTPPTSTTPPAAGGMDSSRTVGSASTPTTTTTAPMSSSTSSADNWYPDHAVLSATKDDVKTMPEFKY